MGVELSELTLESSFFLRELLIAFVLRPVNLRHEGGATRSDGSIPESLPLLLARRMLRFRAPDRIIAFGDQLST
ncbi:MAG TPA: hypothetical protein VIY86_06965, partial [Pirellulaceae bacterium]